MDSFAFRQGMRLLCSGVTIVTSRHDDMATGLTATAVCSLSAEPPRLLACINRAGVTCRAMRESGIFCVNVLTAEHEALARRFAAPADGPNGRFAEGSWTRLATGAPVLDGCLAAFDCTVSALLDQGSHVICIGDVQEVRTAPGARPLLYMDGAFLTAGALMENAAAFMPRPKSGGQ